MSKSGSCVLMLHEPQQNLQIPIIIGRTEAQCILLALNPDEYAKLRRPMTHGLMTSMMRTYGLTLKKVTIDRVVEGIFYATLYVSDGFNETMFDSRTTDAVTLALLQNAPIFVEESVLEATGMRIDPPANQPRTIEQLEEELRKCEEAEDYERAAEIQADIDKLRTKH